MRVQLRGAVRRALVASAFAVFMPAEWHDTQAQPSPDGRTVSSSGGVELCRPRGRCFVPETDDPAFVGDEIKTLRPGRLELSVRGEAGTPIALVILTPNSAMRLDSGSRVPVEIDLDAGLLIVEVVGPPGIDITFGNLGCRIERGSMAIAFNEVDGRRGAAYIANRDADCICFTEARTTHPIERGSVAHFRRGKPASVTPLTDAFWGNLSEQR